MANPLIFSVAYIIEQNPYYIFTFVKKGRGKAISATGQVCKFNFENETITIDNKCIIPFEEIKCIFQEILGNAGRLINDYADEIDSCYEIMDELQKDLSHS